MPNNTYQPRTPVEPQSKIEISRLALSVLLIAATLIGLVTGIFAATSNLTPDHTVAATPSPTLVLQISPTALLGAQDLAPTGTPSPDPRIPLTGRRIGLDPGHGPREDLGAVYLDPDTGRIALSEAEFNLDIALRTRDILRARGAEVVVTRETGDTFIIPWPDDNNGNGIPGESGDELQARIDIINNFNADVFLSIHANSASEPGNGDDIQVLYCGASDCAFPEENKALSTIIMDHLYAALTGAGIPIDGGSTLDDLDIDDTGLHLFMLGPAVPPRHPRAIAMPGVLGETLYITLPSSAALLQRDDVRQVIALAYADALEEYLTK